MEILGVIDVPVWFILLVLSLVLLYIYGSYPMRTWEQLGVPGPKPLPFIGNAHQLYKSEKGFCKSIQDMVQQHGKIVGIHIFRNKYLIVTDLEALKVVFVKDFNNFVDRFHIGDGSFFQDAMLKTLFFSRGMNWKRQRRIVSPSFTSGKLKLLTHYVNTTARQLSDKLEQHATEGTLAQAKQTFGAFALDVIAGTAFGLDLDSQNNLDGPFLQHASRFFELKRSLKFAMGVASIFPFTGSILRWMNMTILDDRSVNFYEKEITKLVMERKNNPEQFGHADFLQLLLNAEMDPSEDVVGDNKLTTEEVVSQGIVFVLGGFETTSTAMQFIAYLLVKHPDVQDRLVEEIKEIVGDTDEVTHELCNSLKFMEAVIYETLRMYPPLTGLNRKAQNTTTLNGYTVPAGTAIRICPFNIGRDPDTYENPDTFDPDRFMNMDSKLMANSIGFMSFGFGPRQCVGMRLAIMEIKIALVHMLRRVCFVEATPDVLVLDDYIGMLSARIPIQIQVTKR